MFSRNMLITLSLFVVCGYAWTISETGDTTPVTCYRYDCGVSSDYSVDSECIVQKNEVFLVRGCPTGQSCTPTNNSPVLCQNRSVITNRYPGEYCESNTECVPLANGVGSCILNKCQGIPATGACTSDSQCTPGTYCDTGASNTCIASKASGVACTKDAECMPGYSCHNTSDTNQVCTQYYSLAAGEFVKNCKANNYNNRSCQSGICYEDAQGNGKCLGKLSVLSNLPCSQNNNCVTDPDPTLQEVMYTSCACSNNKTGEAYCMRAPGNTQVAEYWMYINEWKNSPQINQCSQLNPYSLYCVKGIYGASSDFYEQYAYYTTMATEWQVMAHNQDCYLESIYPQFYGPQPTPSDTDDDDDFSWTLSFTIIGMAFALIQESQLVK